MIGRLLAWWRGGGSMPRHPSSGADEQRVVLSPGSVDAPGLESRFSPWFLDQVNRSGPSVHKRTEVK